MRENTDQNNSEYGRILRSEREREREQRRKPARQTDILYFLFKSQNLFLNQIISSHFTKIIIKISRYDCIRIHARDNNVHQSIGL